jgi:hypothetical protein
VEISLSQGLHCDKTNGEKTSINQPGLDPQHQNYGGLRLLLYDVLPVEENHGKQGRDSDWLAPESNVMLDTSKQNVFWEVLPRELQILKDFLPHFLICSKTNGKF